MKECLKTKSNLYEKVLIICLLVLENQIVVSACGISPMNAQVLLGHWRSSFLMCLSRGWVWAGAERLRSASVIVGVGLSEL